MCPFEAERAAAQHHGGLEPTQANRVVHLARVSDRAQREDARQMRPLEARCPRSRSRSDQQLIIRRGLGAGAAPNCRARDIDPDHARVDAMNPVALVEVRGHGEQLIFA